MWKSYIDSICIIACLSFSSTIGWVLLLCSADCAAHSSWMLKLSVDLQHLKPVTVQSSATNETFYCLLPSNLCYMPVISSLSAWGTSYCSAEQQPVITAHVLMVSNPSMPTFSSPSAWGTWTEKLCLFFSSHQPVLSAKMYQSNIREQCCYLTNL